MCKRTTSRRVVALAILAFVLCAATGVFVYKKTRQILVPTTPAVLVPSTPGLTELHKFHWETYFFPALDERTKKVDLPSLRTTMLADTDVEVRFWTDSSPDTINGFLLRRHGDRWSATRLYQTRRSWPSPVHLQDLGAPKSGWDAFWKQLVGAGVLVLPDSDDTNCLSGGLDGIGYVFEVVAENRYRTYRYHNPQFGECEEAKRVVSIVDLMVDEFNIRSRHH